MKSMLDELKAELEAKHKQEMDALRLQAQQAVEADTQLKQRLVKENTFLKKAFTTQHQQGKAVSAQVAVSASLSSTASSPEQTLRQQLAAAQQEVASWQQTVYALRVHMAASDGSMAGCNRVGGDFNRDVY